MCLPSHRISDTTQGRWRLQQLCSNLSVPTNRAMTPRPSMLLWTDQEPATTYLAGMPARRKAAPGSTQLWSHSTMAVVYLRDAREQRGVSETCTPCTVRDMLSLSTSWVLGGKVGITCTRCHDGSSCSRIVHTSIIRSGRSLGALGDIQAAGHLLRVQRVAGHVPQVQAPQHGPRAHALQRPLRRVGVEQRQAAPGCRAQGNFDQVRSSREREKLPASGPH